MNRRLRLQKQKGTENVADMGTKHLGATVLEGCMLRAGLQQRSGRSAKALQSAAA